MLPSLIGILLILAVLLHYLTIVQLWKSGLPLLIVPLLIYLNILQGIGETALLFILFPTPVFSAEWAFKLFLVSQLFLPIIASAAMHSHSLSPHPPRLQKRQVVMLLLALPLALFIIFNRLFLADFLNKPIFRPMFTGWFGFYLIFFFGMLGKIIFQIFRRQKNLRRKADVKVYSLISRLVIPVTLLCFIANFLLPWLGIFHSAFLLGFPLLSFAVVFAELRLDPFRSWLFPGQILLLLVNLAVIFSLLIFTHSLSFNIHPALLLFILGVFFHLNLRFFKPAGTPEETAPFPANTDGRFIARFSREISQYQTIEELARFALKQIAGTLNFQKAVLILTTNDISPYRVAGEIGFSNEALNAFIKELDNPVIEHLEIERIPLNRFELSGGDALHKAMERLNIYLGFPLLSHHSLIGFILLGDNRQQHYLSPEQFQQAELLCTITAGGIAHLQNLENLKQSQKLAGLGMVASQLAHDFQSFITLVKLELKENRRLRDHADYMEKLVRDLLNYSRPQELRLKPVKINDIIEMSLDLIQIPDKIVVEKNLSGDLPPIHLDSDLMRRVFTNLFENSIRAMKNAPKGRLKITTRPLRPISKIRQNPWVYIEILDDGEGIPEEFLEKIFEPFFTTHKHEGGNGMGLAMVKQIIYRHKGHIDVASRAEKGTIFNIRLPYNI
ncbi:MAG: hypothetical protein Kow0037_20410 [Calditrichia bacterium]